jgi:hypothetical protein
LWAQEASATCCSISGRTKLQQQERQALLLLLACQAGTLV